MSLLLLVLGALVAWRLNARLKAMARAIAALTDRLDQLQYGGHASSEPAAEPTPIFAPEPESVPTVRDVPPPPEGVAAEPPRERASEWLSLERWIGAEGLLYIGVAALIVGAAYFEKLAIDNEWI